MTNGPYLSVVIPCYNEEKNLQRDVLDQVERYLKKQSYSSEVIVSDDQSTDGSLALVEKYVRNHPRFKLLKNKHGGKPFALRSGIKKARGEIILTTDMDQSTPINQLAKLLPYFEKGFEIVIGSRGQARQGFSLLRQIASRVFIFFRKTILLREIGDTQCGFKAYKNEVVKDLFSRLLIFKAIEKARGWTVGAFDVELLFIAQKKGYRIAEVQVRWQDEDRSTTKGELKSRFFKESKEMFFEILRVKLNDFKGLYG